MTSDRPHSEDGVLRRAIDLALRVNESARVVVCLSDDHETEVTVSLSARAKAQDRQSLTVLVAA